MVARFAHRYCERGLALTWTTPGGKGPRHAGWNLPERAIKDPEIALELWSRHPELGIAALLKPSGLVSIDIDDEGHSRTVFDHFGIDLHDLRESAPCIVGRHYRLMYRAPEAMLTHRTMAWPQQTDPRWGFALFEFRAGLVADMLPPSVHPALRTPYRWENPPAAGFPPLPSRLLELWLDWDQFSAKARALCPWAPPPTPPRPTRPAAQRAGPSVIAAFNDAHDPAAILEAHGYSRKGKRFASPGTAHAAGIVIMESGRVFCHQQGDPLRSDHALDAFDIYRVLDHGGDFRAAVRAAAEALGIGRSAG